MPVYDYTALDLKGKTVSGIIDADSASLARQKLRDAKTFPVSIKEVFPTALKKERKTISISRPFSRVSSSEISMMTRQLSTLVGAGFPLVSAIYTLIPHTKSPTLKKILSRIKDAIEEGNSFADALSQYPGIFTAIYINMIRAAETSGTLEIVLERLSDISERQQALSNRIRAALVYPILMTILATGILFFLLTYIVPSVTAMFSEMDQILPAPTRILIAVSDFIRTYWIIILVGIACLTTALSFISKTARGRYLLDKSILISPIIGEIAKKIAVGRFSRTLGSLLENGVSMLPALEIVRNIVGNVLIAETIEKASMEVEKGHGLNTALGAAGVFPHLSVQMIQVGEQSGKLESMLNKVADVFENEVESTVNGITSLLEPMIIIIMGITVGFIVLAILLPIFEMNQLVR